MTLARGRQRDALPDRKGPIHMKTIAPARSVLLALMILTIQLPVTDARAEGVGSYLSTTSSDRPNPSRSELDAPDEWVIVRISVPSFTASAVRTAKEMGFHLATEREPVRGSFDLAVPLGRLGELSTLGWEYRVLREDVTTPRSQSDKPGPPGTLIDPEYHTYEEMTQELASLYATHPEIAFMESLGVSTLEHRVMWGFKISDNVGVNEDEPAVLYVSTHHGCEMIGMEYCLLSHQLPPLELWFGQSRHALGGRDGDLVRSTLQPRWLLRSLQ